MRMICLLTVFISVISFGQQPVLEQTISITATKQSIEEVLSQITTKSGIGFVYSPNLVDLKQKVTIDCKNKSLESILQLLFANTSITYKFIDGQIILKQKQKRRVVSGYIEDGGTGERLIYATINESLSGTSASTNMYGFYSISVPEGEADITFSYVGYKSHTSSFNISSDTSLSLSLNPDTVSLKEVIVLDNPSLRMLQSTQTGLSTISMQNLKELPTLLGEKDLIKSLQALPGVQSNGEGNNGLLVRGGNADQNLFLLDGVPVYNLNHLFGFFSVLNSETVQNTSFYKSGFPARYGGRLSSIVDMKLKEGNSKFYEGKFTIGTMSASANVEGPLGKRASFFGSYRRTYLDIFTIPLMAIVNAKNKDTSNTNLNAGFYDYIGKINYTVSEKSKLYLSVYVGGDSYGSSYRGGKLIDTSTISWNNISSALRWNYKINNQLFCNTALTCSYFDFGIFAESSGIDSFQRKVFSSNNLNSGITDWALRSDFEYYISPKHTMQFGIGNIIHNFKPGKVDAHNEIDLYKSNITFGRKILLSNEAIVYAEDEFSISQRFKITAGANFSMMNVESNYDFSLQPRVSARYTLAKPWVVKASYARMTQYLQMISEGASSFVLLDIWVPAGQSITPKHSDQFALGTVFSPNASWELSAEGYYKKMTNLIEERPEESIHETLVEWDRNLTTGSGNSYGFEFLTQKRGKRLSGWVAYTLTLSERSHNTIFGSMLFTQQNTHKHMINFDLQYNLSPKWNFTALWTFGSGKRITFPTQKYASMAPGIKTAYYIEGLNQKKLEPYHRLDLGCSYKRKKNRHEAIWNFSVYNIYNRQNSSFVEIRQQKFIKYSYFSFIPSVSYTLAFNIHPR